MSKNLLRSEEVFYDQSVHVIEDQQPKMVTEQSIDEVQAIPQWEGPTLDELQKEADRFKRRWRQEKQAIIDNANNEANVIQDSANSDAKRKIAEAADHSAQLIEEAKKNSSEIIRLAEEKAKQIMEEARNSVENIVERSKREGYDEGYEKGCEEHHKELDNLAHRLKTIMSQVVERRNEILENAEIQIIQIVILIARKIVKIISEEHCDVVRRNIIAALENIEKRDKIIIRINPLDTSIARQRREQFIAMLERGSTITFLEDELIEPGGCLVETDIGEIDARISSQLMIIENELRKIMPIKKRAKPASIER